MSKKSISLKGTHWVAGEEDAIYGKMWSELGSIELVRAYWGRRRRQTGRILENSSACIYDIILKALKGVNNE